MKHQSRICPHDAPRHFLRILPAEDRSKPRSGSGIRCRRWRRWLRDFVSVTYGAGGTTRDLTRDAVKALHKQSGLARGAHLTCVNATREETLADRAGILPTPACTDIVALRGDPPKGADALHAASARGSRIQLRADRGAEGRQRDFTIRVGAYPDMHPEAGSQQSGCRLAQAQVRRRRRRGDHAVLLRGRDLLPLPRRLREGRYRQADRAGHLPRRELEGRPPLRRMLRHQDPPMGRSTPSRPRSVTGARNCWPRRSAPSSAAT